jgi:hypothetical protein
LIRNWCARVSLLDRLRDVSRDGKRFLMLKPAAEDASAREIVVVQNWNEELKRRMAAAKK